MDYLLDTNILVIYSRESEIADKIEAEFQIFNGDNNIAISVVTLGELNSLAKRFNYGNRRKQRIEKLVEKLFTIDTNIKEIIERYGDIDAYSQGKLEGNPLGTSSRNMGKNDLWIAATASVFDMVLITTDKDFQHLDKTFMKLKYIDLDKYKKEK
ncbi:MAG: type II toxin-antitoxin system VapC family toxin [Bacteroidota bacterium]